MISSSFSQPSSLPYHVKLFNFNCSGGHCTRISSHLQSLAQNKSFYVMFKDVFDPIIFKFPSLPEDFKHTSDMGKSKIKGNINEKTSVKSTRLTTTSINLCLLFGKKS